MIARKNPFKDAVRWLVIWSFSWSQVSAAKAPEISLQAKALAAVKDQLRLTGIGNRKVKFKDFLARSKDTIPLDLRYEMELFAKGHPDYILPTADVRMIRQGRQDAIQITFTEGKESANAILNFKSLKDIGSFNYTKKGKSYHLLLNEDTAEDSVGLMNSVLAPGKVAVTKQMHFVRFLRARDIRQMRPQDQKNYLHDVSEIVTQMEKLQRAIIKSSKKSALHKTFKTLIEEAFADEPITANTLLAAGALDGTECPSYDWVGTLKNGKCQPPPEASATYCDGHVCNPDIAGGDATGHGYCVPEPPAGVTTAEHCETQAAAKKPERKFKLTGLRGDELDKGFDDWTMMLTRFRHMCLGFKASATEIKQECDGLKKSLDGLEDFNCRLMAVYKGPDYKCDDAERAQKTAEDLQTLLAQSQNRGKDKDQAAPPGQQTSGPGTRDDERATAQTAAFPPLQPVTCTPEQMAASKELVACQSDQVTNSFRCADGMHHQCLPASTAVAETAAAPPAPQPPPQPPVAAAASVPPPPPAPHAAAVSHRYDDDDEEDHSHGHVAATTTSTTVAAKSEGGFNWSSLIAPALLFGGIALMSTLQNSGTQSYYNNMMGYQWAINRPNSAFPVAPAVQAPGGVMGQIPVSGTGFQTIPGAPASGILRTSFLQYRGLNGGRLGH
ncbi:MAG: hypothetical protein C5B49_11015 [Bdellovibrio sp.]|nr:MAG: hypothetical protein C5B49_11015 [Bdellovibrio sp.]